MRKYILTFVVLLQSTIVLGQSPEIKTDLPTVIPPSPTVATLMKFEEVPVDNYTGTPDISMPLLNLTGKYGLAFNMTLNYSPSSIKREEIAGYTGLGWSLLAGGTISRTVRDIPDDAFVSANNFHSKKVGLYHNDNGLLRDRNNYYEIESFLTSNYNFEDENDSINNNNINRFLFESGVKNQFDSKHDLYQFNFMGYTGRFIIKKKPDKTFEIVKLDKYNLIINYNHTLKKFEIKDTKGFTYVFDIKEISTTHSVSFAYKIDNSLTENLIGDTQDYISAFQLSKIYYAGELVADFTYASFGEEQRVSSETYNMPVNPELQTLINVHHSEDACALGSTYISNGTLPVHVYNINEVGINTKKIKRIKIIDRAIIDFDTQTGDRIDTNLKFPESKPYLNKITIRSWDTLTIVKEYKFDYLFAHKMFLDQVQEGTGANQYSKYELRYEGLDLDYGNFISDYWGYYKLGSYENDCVNYSNRSRETDKIYCKKDVLKQIIYPTKGSAIFEFESNTYSYIGDYEILDSNEDGYFDDFRNNPDNTTITSLTPIVLSSGSNPSGIGTQTHSLGISTTDRNLVFNTTFTGADTDNLGFLQLSATNPNGLSNPPQPKGLYTAGCPVELLLKAGFNYNIVFNWGTSTGHTISATINIDEKVANTTLKRWLYGGGIRIKNIYYTTDDPVELSTQSYPNNYSRKIGYNYNFFDSGQRSSGSLTFLKPIMRYETQRVFNHLAGEGNCHEFLTGDIFSRIKYDVYSSSNTLSCVSTKGADVGYKNVTVSETGNGSTSFEYYSPIDWPEDMNARTVVYPFAPSPNIDYKRGILIQEKKFDLNNRILSEKENHYEFENHLTTTGFTMFSLNPDCPYAGMFNDYDTYRYGVLDPMTYPTGIYLPNGLQEIAGSQLNWNVRSCGSNVNNFIGYYPLKEAYGWAKLDNTISKEYFYDSNNAQHYLEKSISYTYNNDNMQLASQTMINSTGDSLKTDYYYVINPECDSEPEIAGLRAKNMVDTLLKIETFKNTTKLSEQKVLYIDWGNSLYLLGFIKTAKGTQALEKRIEYTDYDEYGHPLEVRQEDGTPVSYVWGYNKSQPIAKIENCSYSSIPAALITAAQTASDTGSGLIGALNELRAGVPASAMITTYTYKPLVGVSTITDPKGYTTTYEYDSFGRLSAVKDHLGNKLSENDYHYKN